MPSTEINDNTLLEIFNSLQSASTVKSKSDLLYKAKLHVLNEMSDEHIIQFFVLNKTNFENLFLLDIWTSSLEDSNGIAEFNEPYDIIEKIFSCFDSLPNFVSQFYHHIIHLLEQNKDEKIKHLCVKHLIRLTKRFSELTFFLLQLLQDRNLFFFIFYIQLDFNLLSEMERNLVEFEMKQLMPHFVKQIPNTTVAYSNLLAELLCCLTNPITEQFVKDDQMIDYFSSSLSEQGKSYYRPAIFENNTELFKEFDDVSRINSIQSFRVFEIIVKLASCSPDHLNKLAEKGFNFSNRVQAYLNGNNDILSKLNCIELLTSLAKTNHGYEYLKVNGYLDKFLVYLKEPIADPFVSFLIPAVVKLFSHIVRHKFETFDYPDYYNFLFDKALSEYTTSNHADVDLAVQTFSFLFEINLVTEKIYKSYEKQFLLLIEKLIHILQTCINDILKANSLLCIAEMIAPDPSLLHIEHTDLKWSESPWVTSEYVDFTHELYKKLTEKCSHEQFFNICFTLAKKPIFETRQAAQFYFKALCQTRWGLNYLFSPNKFNSHEKFVDGYLLNRLIEVEKNGLESKYELIKLILASFNANPDLIPLIGEHNIHRLKGYILEGPFYTKAEHRVAFESV